MKTVKTFQIQSSCCFCQIRQITNVFPTGKKTKNGKRQIFRFVFLRCNDWELEQLQYFAMIFTKGENICNIFGAVNSARGRLFYIKRDVHNFETVHSSTNKSFCWKLFLCLNLRQGGKNTHRTITWSNNVLFLFI